MAAVRRDKDQRAWCKLDRAAGCARKDAATAINGANRVGGVAVFLIADPAVAGTSAFYIGQGGIAPEFSLHRR